MRETRRGYLVGGYGPCHRPVPREPSCCGPCHRNEFAASCCARTRPADYIGEQQPVDAEAEFGEKVSEWNGQSTHATSRCWVDELNAGVKVARLGIRHGAGKFSARPEMIGRVTRWDGEHFEVVFRPEIGHGTTGAET